MELLSGRATLDGRIEIGFVTPLVVDTKPLLADDLNDNVDGSEFGKGGIYVDGALRWFYGESLIMTLIFRDLTGNFGLTQGVGREFELALIESF